MPKKFVITGGPCSGKTTTIKALSSEFYIIDESAREIIEQEIKQGKLRGRFDVKERQLKILRLQLQREKEAEKQNKNILLDRGIPDSIAYFKLFNENVLEELLKQSKKEKTKYEKIFLLDLLPFKKEKVREQNEENEEIATKIHNLIFETYKELGYNVITVPVLPIKDRIKFIKEKI